MYPHSRGGGYNPPPPPPSVPSTQYPQPQPQVTRPPPPQPQGEAYPTRQFTVGFSGYYGAYAHLNPQYQGGLPPPPAMAAYPGQQQWQRPPPLPSPHVQPPPRISTHQGQFDPYGHGYGKEHDHSHGHGRHEEYGHRSSREESRGRRHRQDGREDRSRRSDSRGEHDSSERSTPCLYCHERFRTEPQHLMHRQSRHTMLDFGCGKCNFQSPFADQLASHLVLAHQITDARREDMVALSTRGLARLPSDLRSLRCRLCLTHGRRRFLLGQDRVALRSHVERGHDGLRIGLKALKYECRICGEEFPQTEEFLRHPCCEANGQSRILPHPLMPEEGQEQQHPAAKRIRTEDDSTASTSRKEEGDADDAEQCLYCERKVNKNSKASHRAAHWQLEFICDVDCSRSFAFVEDLLEHVKAVHKESLKAKAEKTKDREETREEEEADDKIEEDQGIGAEDDDGEIDPVQLAMTKKVMLPADLRRLECNLCPPDSKTILLAQDRYALKKHVRKEHGEMDFDKNMASYKCRLCGRGDFSSSESLLDHQCVKTLMKGQSKSSVSTNDVRPEKDEKLLDLLDIKWEDPAEGNEGDLRRLACRLCGHQTNGRRFFAMVEHLEGVHDMFQESRFYSLDKYVMFRCAKCELFEPSDVHSWATHFHKSDATQCAATMPSTSSATVPTTATEAEMERKRRAEEEEADAMEKKEDRINPKDIRTMQCKICDTFIDKCRFLPMQEHLRKEHPTETVRTLILDSFVKFGCSLCPDFEPDSFHAWDSHFYKSYETCKNTYRESKKAEEQKQTAPATASTSGSAPLVGAGTSNFAEDDLRRLICQLCQVEISKVGFAGMGEHLKASHDVDVLTSKENFEEHVEFACAACPAFKPPTVMLWDSHFGDSFKTCQGSGKVYSRLKRKVLYWCEACAETRADLEQHLKGSSHAKTVQTLEEKSQKEESTEHQKFPLLSCDECPVKVASEANLHLHKNLSGHAKEASSSAS